MCGIVGFISKHKSPETIGRMLSSLKHRGPDDSGIYVEQVDEHIVHLGHNRLSIQDLSSHGHQPFVSDCKNYVIVFNGEVYNFKNIRKELQTKGYRFVSESDTEVILYAYKEWGKKCLDKFIGMFAFSILDKPKKKIFLVRDRAGVKPLYYYATDKVFMFASELKSFHEHPDFQKELNKDVLPYYFQFGYIPAPHTIFKNAHKLEPGHILELHVTSYTLRIDRYWSIDECFAAPKFEKSEAEILTDLEALLTNAVEKRMVSDVPVGVFLSGGYDSSLVTALLSKNKERKLHTYTIGFAEKKYNEAEHAKSIAAHFGTKHTEYYVTMTDMLNKVKELPFYYDEPFGDSSAIPTMIVSKMARKEVTVALSADGGDEAFCGYSKYFFLKRFETIFEKPFQKELLNGMLTLLDGKRVSKINALLPKNIKQTNLEEKYNKFKRAIGSKSLEEMFRNASSYVDNNDIQKFLKINPKTYTPFAMQKDLTFLDNMMRIDYKTFMVDDVLTKVDRATMSASLEGREPLLDHRIIEYMARVPEKLKYKNNQGKYLLRKLLYKYIPKEMIDKPKAGFQIPLGEWLKKDLKPLIEHYLSPSRLDKDIFDIDYIQKMKYSVYAGKIQYVNALWFILMYEMWRERWLLQNA